MMLTLTRCYSAAAVILLLAAGATVSRANINEDFDANQQSEEGAAPANEDAAATDHHQRSRKLFTSFTMDFEGVGNGVPVGNYYNGGRGGPRYGIEFGSTFYTAVDSDNGGYGPIANEPSPSTIMGIFEETGNYSRGSFVNVRTGFVSVNFMYSSAAPVNISVYSGLSRTGDVLSNEVIPPTGVCGVSGKPACGDPTGNVGIWERFTVSFFPGIAKSVGFSAADQFLLSTIAIDDMSIALCTSYLLYDAPTQAIVAVIQNDSLVCVPPKYNMEAFPCFKPTNAVGITLKNSKGDIVWHTKDSTDPYLLYGPRTNPNVIKSSFEPLAPGTYTLQSTVGGAVTFRNGKRDKNGICREK